MVPLIYADNAATTRLDDDAFEAMKPYLLNEYGNPSQPYSFARPARDAIKKARQKIASLINATPDEVFFTSGGTESDNWAIKGSAFSDALYKATITSQIEHHAILNSCRTIERLGYPVTYVGASKSGVVTAQALEGLINTDTRLVSVMMANNEIGTIQPVRELCAIAHSNGAAFHTDAVQALGHIQVDVNDLGVDMLSASAHKFNGPKGIGFLYIRKGTRIEPYIDGGAQEAKMRAGTENVALIVGMAVALENNIKRIDENQKKLRELEDALINNLMSANLNLIVNGGCNRIPGNISLSFHNADGEMLLHRLDLMGISVSTGSACDGNNSQVSHVIKAIQVDKAYAKGTIRVSFGRYNTPQDAQTISAAIIKIFRT